MAPKAVSVLILRTCESGTSHTKGTLQAGAVQGSRCEVVPDSPVGSATARTLVKGKQGSQSESRSRDDTQRPERRHCWLWRRERVMAKGGGRPPEAGKGEEMTSPGPPEGSRWGGRLGVSQARPSAAFRRPGWCGSTWCRVNHLVAGDLLQQQWGNGRPFNTLGAPTHSEDTQGPSPALPPPSLPQSQ